MHGAGEPIPRITPYEVAFGEALFERTVFPALEREAEAGGLDPALRDRFAFLPGIGDLLRQLVPDEADAEALRQFRALLFHAFNFYRFGHRLFVLDPGVARYLVEASPSLEEWSFALPHPSLYLQLPANLFWASITPEATPEPVDGIFATAAPGADPLGPPSRRLEVLLVLGVRRDRAGFSVIPLDTEVGPGIAPPWTDPPGREGGAEFANVLPGGEIDGLYSILTTTEALKLLARALWYAERHPGDPEIDPPAETPAPGGLSRTRFPYRRLTLRREKDGA